MVLNPGTTAGDTVDFGIPRIVREPFGVDELIATLILLPAYASNNSPMGDTCRVGFVGGGNHGFVDFENTQLNFRGTTYSLGGLPSNNQLAVVMLKTSPVDEESRVVIRGAGVNIDKTVKDYAMEGDKLVEMVSNGNGDELRVRRVRVDLGWSP